MNIRTLVHSDASAVRDLLRAAFPTAVEADLVERLRADGDVEVGLVAESEGRIAGHILFSRMDAPFRALALAPLAVAPERQRAGIGAALVEAGHAAARAAGWEGAFVLGDPAYYLRFGYSLAAAAPFSSPYAGPHFMLLPFRPISASGGEVSYAPAFAELG